MDQTIHLAGGAISVTGTCTLTCRHCYSNSSPVVREAYSIEQLCRFIEIFSALGIKHIFFGGGEPLLHPDIDRAVRCARIHDMTVSISSNGELINGVILRRLFSVGLSHDLSISIDGPNEKINKSLRGRWAFVFALRGMYELKKFEKILWGSNYVSCRPNYGMALETAMLVRRLGGSYFNLIRFSLSGRGIANRNRLWITDREFEEEVARVGSEFPRISNFYGDIYLYDLRGDLRKNVDSYFDNPDFQGLPSGISIHHQGKVDLTPAGIKLGNCYEEDLEVIVERINRPSVLGEYNKWLRGEREGVHHPNKKIQGLKINRF